MDEREEMARSLRATIGGIERALRRAKDEGRLLDYILLASMKRSCEYALGILTDRFYGQRPRLRVLRPGPPTLTPRQERLLEMALGKLTPLERKLALLTVGHDVSLEAAAVALGLPLEEARKIENSMVDKLRTIKRNYLASGGEAIA